MDGVRVLALDNVPSNLPCCRCERADRNWDRIAGKAYCPNCQEMLAVGEGRPLVERTEKRRCAVCNRLGTVRFASYPLQQDCIVSMDLCAEHLRGLVGRSLGPYAYHQLRRQLKRHRLSAHQFFLLHDAFYDTHGRALQPAC
jgi:hypothetical protein